MRVVICGAGVIGAAIAHFLAERGVAATVVESTRIAAAASGKSGGFLALDWCDTTPLGTLARRSFALHLELAESLPARYGFRRMETLMAVASEHERLSSPRGMGPDWLDGECEVAGTIGSEQTTAQVHPGQFTEALIASATRRGARLHMGRVEGLALSADGSRLRGVRVAGEVLEADAAVVAMGPWSQQLGPELGLPPIGGLKGYSITLRPRAAVPAQALFVEYDGAGERTPAPEIFPRPDGEVYMCGLSGDEPVPEEPDQVSVDEDACRELARIAGRLSRRLDGAALTAMQACYRPSCSDALPLIGPCPHVDGAFVATGHNCWGILNAPGTGLAVAELLLDGAASIDLEPFAPGRLDRR